MIDTFNAGMNSVDENDPDLNMIVKTAYGFLNGNPGDCMGWSGTFYTLCNMVGVPCIVVDAKSGAGGPVDSFVANHRFNMVVLDEETYFVEVFWFYQKLSDSDGDWRYFNMTSEQAAKSHIWANESNKGAPYVNFTTYQVDAVTGELL